RCILLQRKECWKCAFQHTPTFSIEPLFSSEIFSGMSFTACGRDWLKFQTKRGDVQQSVVTFVGNAILFWYFMRKMTKIKIMLTKHLKM
ncbi:hypothetical protein, partial [[Clostridium] symbiosum]|uniref:hypothetical protein n=1 Tax=Clostridium symbiosum TaxID=1512 RepID=UPI001A9AF158